MKHICHALKCSVEVPPNLLMCRRHWYMVPAPIRRAVWRVYRPGQETDKSPTQEYLVITRQAIEAVAKKEGHL